MGGSRSTTTRHRNVLGDCDVLTSAPVCGMPMLRRNIGAHRHPTYFLATIAIGILSGCDFYVPLPPPILSQHRAFYSGSNTFLQLMNPLGHLFGLLTAGRRQRTSPTDAMVRCGYRCQWTFGLHGAVGILQRGGCSSRWISMAMMAVVMLRRFLLLIVVIPGMVPVVVLPVLPLAMPRLPRFIFPAMCKNVRFFVVMMMAVRASVMVATWFLRTIPVVTTEIHRWHQNDIIIGRLTAATPRRPPTFIPPGEVAFDSPNGNDVEVLTEMMGVHRCSVRCSSRRSNAMTRWYNLSVFGFHWCEGLPTVGPRPLPIR